MSSFEEIEDAPEFEQESFFLESRFPDLKYRFWVGPDDINLARAVKARCREDTRRRNNNQAAQDPWPEDKFSDPNHEYFYQWCISKNDAQGTDLDELFNSYLGRYEIAQEELVLKEKEIQRYIQVHELMQSQQRLTEELETIDSGYNRDTTIINQEISRLQQVLSEKKSAYDRKRQPLAKRLEEIIKEQEANNTDSDDSNISDNDNENKKPRLRGLYCAHCLKLKKGGGEI
jgi:DNA polymerase III alpha subunit (gram-positive type)